MALQWKAASRSHQGGGEVKGLVKRKTSRSQGMKLVDRTHTVLALKRPGARF